LFAAPDCTRRGSFKDKLALTIGKIGARKKQALCHVLEKRGKEMEEDECCMNKTQSEL
jgi:hypothetical protein